MGYHARRARTVYFRAGRIFAEGLESRAVRKRFLLKVGIGLPSACDEVNRRSLVVSRGRAVAASCKRGYAETRSRVLEQYKASEHAVAKLYVWIFYAEIRICLTAVRANRNRLTGCRFVQSCAGVNARAVRGAGAE